MLPNLSLVMEFLGSVFTNFIFLFLLHEALVTGRVTATSNNQTQLLFKYSCYKSQKFFERYTQLLLFPKQIHYQSYLMS